MMRSCQDAQVKWRSVASDRPPHTQSSCPDLIRAFIILRRSLAKRMDCRVKPGNDQAEPKSRKFGDRHVGAASNWSCDIPQGHSARSHRAGAGIFESSGREGAPDLETDRAG